VSATVARTPAEFIGECTSATFSGGVLKLARLGARLRVNPRHGLPTGHVEVVLQVQDETYPHVMVLDLEQAGDFFEQGAALARALRAQLDAERVVPSLLEAGRSSTSRAETSPPAEGGASLGAGEDAAAEVHP